MLQGIFKKKKAVKLSAAVDDLAFTFHNSPNTVFTCSLDKRKEKKT